MMKLELVDVASPAVEQLSRKRGEMTKADISVTYKNSVYKPDV